MPGPESSQPGQMHEMHELHPPQEGDLALMERSTPTSEALWEDFDFESLTKGQQDTGEVAVGANVEVVNGEAQSKPQGFGEQLSIENELGIGWPVTEAAKGTVPNSLPETDYQKMHLPDMSPLEEAQYTGRYITHAKAYEEATSGKIDWAEFGERIADKNPRTYQQPLLRQNGQVFEQEKPFVNDPNIGVATEDGTFWHGSSQLMEPGDRVLPSGEVPDAVHKANESRSFKSSSSPKSGAYDNRVRPEKDFAFGVPREVGYLPRSFGEYIYKVSSPNSEVVRTSNGDEMWAEGGAKVEKLMHRDFADNYRQASARVNNDPFQPGLPGMENGLQFVAEKELDVSGKEFYDKYMKQTGEVALQGALGSVAGPEDLPLPGFENHGKRPDIPTAPSDSPM